MRGEPARPPVKEIAARFAYEAQDTIDGLALEGEELRTYLTDLFVDLADSLGHGGPGRAS
jgi:hypothetical protein